MIDKLSVVSDQGRNLITNHDFEDHVQGYVIQGNHVQSTHNREEGLKVREVFTSSVQYGDNGANRIEVQIASPRSGDSHSEVKSTFVPRLVGLEGTRISCFEFRGTILKASALDVPNELGRRKSKLKGLEKCGARYRRFHRPIEPLATEPSRFGSGN